MHSSTFQPTQTITYAEKLEKKLLDDEYKQFFSQFTKDQLKNFNFYDDIPGLTSRNAFRLQKIGDKNNQCFDSVHFKQLCKYYFKPSGDEKTITSVTNLTKGAKMTKKQLRRMQINTAHQKRYFYQMHQMAAINRDDTISKKEHLTQQCTLSNKMWLYLEITKSLEDSNKSANIDRTGDFMKYLSENKSDVVKWLEFIDYQSQLTHNKSEILSPAGLYERKVGIFEKAIKENPNSFRLKIELTKLKSNNIEFTNIYNAFETIEREFYMLLGAESIKLNVNKISDSELNEIVLNLFEIWFELIEFSVNYTLSSVLFDQIKRQFSKCFAFFLKSSNKHVTRLVNTSEVYLNCMLQILDNYCAFLVRAGYVEKAVAVYQALIDFNMCSSSPKYNDLDVQNRLTLFGLFWDIGLPKFGEKNSIGWLNCLENREKIFENLENSNDQNTSDQIRYDDLMDSLENTILNRKEVRIEHRWLEIERLRSIVYWYPFYPRTVVGESSDDCCDSDRLINFEDDLSLCLFDLSYKSSDLEMTETFKFKLFLKFLILFNLISTNEQSLDTSSSSSTQRASVLTHSYKLTPDSDFLAYLNENCTLIDEQESQKQNIPFLDCHGYLSILLQNVFDPNLGEDDQMKNLFKIVAQNFIDFIRNCLAQALNSFKSFKFKTYLTILKWRFELELYFLLTKIIRPQATTKLTIVNDFEPSQVKERLLNQAKMDLSLDVNRSNLRLWREYAVLKWILNKGQVKETRKVLDTLLKTSESSQKSTDQACIDIYSLSIDYVLIELGVFYRL